MAGRRERSSLGDCADARVREEDARATPSNLEPFARTPLPFPRRSHGVGKFWPCPALGETVPAAKFIGQPAGPCTYKPNAHKHIVRQHLLNRHGFSPARAAALMAGIKHSPVRSGGSGGGGATAEEEDEDEDEDEEDEEDDAACEVCGSAARAASMLLCDGCDEGYHMACLRPRLTALPAGSWHCPRCVKRRAGKGGPGAAGATGSAAGAETVYPCPCFGERLPGSGGRWPAGP